MSEPDYQLYGYDGVNQIKLLNRGVLNSTNTSVTTSNFTESWNYDGTGNWLQYNRSGTVENRTHNKANEVQTSCTHDRNGNMTVMPGLKGKYDAWNRLVELRNSSDSLLATYGYNGLNQRVKKTVGSVVTTSCFNQQWQELESVTSSQTTAYVWGTRYIDDLVYRDKGSERLYAVADPNWNLVALTNTSGTVQERMKYDAFGKVTWLDTAFVVKPNSSFAWNRTFTGQVLDTETGLMLYRNRYYHTGLGRFVSRDPIGYDGDDASLYRYVLNKPTLFLDMLGYKARDYGNCVRGCEDSCYYIINRPWYLGQWASYLACTGKCPLQCRSLQGVDQVCDLIAGGGCGEAAWGCACDLVGAANVFFSFGKVTPLGIGLGIVDCLCDVMTTLQAICKGNSKLSISTIIASTAGSCLPWDAAKSFSKNPSALLTQFVAGIKDLIVEAIEYAGRGEIPFSTCNNAWCECLDWDAFAEQRKRDAERDIIFQDGTMYDQLKNYGQL